MNKLRYELNVDYVVGRISMKDKISLNGIDYS